MHAYHSAIDNLLNISNLLNLLNLPGAPNFYSIVQIFLI